jgi:hypothetical protein
MEGKINASSITRSKPNGFFIFAYYNRFYPCKIKGANP